MVNIEAILEEGRREFEAEIEEEVEVMKKKAKLEDQQQEQQNESVILNDEELLEMEADFEEDL